MELNARDLQDVLHIIGELTKIEENTGKSFQTIDVWDDGNIICTIKSGEGGELVVDAR